MTSPDPAAPPLEVCDVSIAYGAQAVVHGVSFRLAPGEIGCLLGPSGCGKTSLLRAIAGFEGLTGGEIRLAGRRVAAPGHGLRPEERRVGMVFQDFALFPHLSVADNIAFGLYRQPRAARRQRVAELLDLVGLPHLAERFPHQISGGQQQRIALARALAPRPDLLLLDEPFSGIDADLRERLAAEVRAVLKREGTAAVLVTHDQAEAFAVADAIGVLGDGRLRQWGSGGALYHRPADPFVAGFVGQGSLLPAVVLETGVPAGTVRTPLGPAPATLPAETAAGAAVRVLLRPDDLVVDPARGVSLPVVGRAFRGADDLYTLALPGGETALCLVRSREDENEALMGACPARLSVRLAARCLPAFAADA